MSEGTTATKPEVTVDTPEEPSREFPMFLDGIPTLLKTEVQKEVAIDTVKRMLREQLEKNLDGMIERWREIEAIITKTGPHVNLLIEARALFVEGKYYSCIAMCGITGERIAKDMLIRSVAIVNKKGKAFHPKIEYNEVLDKIPMDIVRNLIVKSETVDADLNKPFQNLAEIRNKYAHGSGDDQEKDAVKAMEYLQTIIDGTVSMFIDYKIENGRFIPKEPSDEIESL